MATFSPNDCMIDDNSSSLEPISRYTVPVPSPAADAMSRTVVTSYPLRPNSARASARTCAAFSPASASLPSGHDCTTALAARKAADRSRCASFGGSAASPAKDAAQHSGDLVRAGVMSDHVETDLQHRLRDPVGQHSEVDIGSEAAAPPRRP
jgi:hypothetical protein